MTTETEASKISEAEKMLKELMQLKKPRVRPFEDDGETLKPKVVWKYDGFMQAILYRVTDIAEDALDVWRKRKPVSSVILARSLMESASAAYWLSKRVSAKIHSGDLAGADKDVDNLSFTCRIIVGLPEGKSVMTYIDAVDKQLLPGFRKIYDIMSEASHPNHMGTLWAYSELDKETYEVTYFDKHPDAADFLDKNMPAALSGSLAIMRVALGNYSNVRSALVELGQEDL